MSYNSTRIKQGQLLEDTIVDLARSKGYNAPYHNCCDYTTPDLYGYKLVNGVKEFLWGECSNQSLTGLKRKKYQHLKAKYHNDDRTKLIVKHIGNYDGFKLSIGCNVEHRETDFETLSNNSINSLFTSNTLTLDNKDYVTSLLSLQWDNAYELYQEHKTGLSVLYSITLNNSTSCSPMYYPISDASVSRSVNEYINVYNQVSSSFEAVLDEQETLYHELKMCRYIARCVALSKEYGVPIQTFIPYFTHAKRRAELDALLVYGKKKLVPVGLTARKMLTLRERINALQYKWDSKERFASSTYFYNLTAQQQFNVINRMDRLQDKMHNIYAELKCKGFILQ